MLKTTIGQLMVNQALPKDLRDYDRVLDSGNLKKLLHEVAVRYPDDYREIVKSLNDIGRYAADRVGGYSFGLPHVRVAVGAKALQDKLNEEIKKIRANDNLSNDEKDKSVVDLMLKHGDEMSETVMREGLAEHNPMALMILSGSKGSAKNARTLRGGDMLYMDNEGKPVPIPITRSYSQGLTPAMFFSGAFGARKGIVATKLGVADTGAFGKLLNQAAHKLVVVAQDSDKPDKFIRGLPTEIDDPDNEGALLAVETGPYKRNTELSPKVISDLRAKGFERLLVRSPVSGGHPNGGLYGRDLGIREKGIIPQPGDFCGISSSQALSEGVVQGALGSKHGAGIAGGRASGPSGFDLAEQLISVPSTFKGGASHAQIDGKVLGIRTAPQGGSYIAINGHDHYVGRGYDLKVKPGDTVEAGDVLSEGIPDPSEVIKHKGIGEGRRYFVNIFTKAYRDSGMPVHRRNVEILSRGLLDHVELQEELGDNCPGDIVSYNHLEHVYEPRKGHKVIPVKHAKEGYLEQPVLHYSIGTQLKPSVLKTLNDFGVQNIAVHPDPPPFQPIMIRGLENISHDPDWLVRFLGGYQKRNFLRGVHRGDSSDEKNVSYVPSLARAVDFGKEPPVKGWTPTKPSPKAPAPAESILKQMLSSEPKIASLIDQIRPKEKMANNEEDIFSNMKKISDPDEIQMLNEDEDDDSDDYPSQVCLPVACYELPVDNAGTKPSIKVLKGTDPKGVCGHMYLRTRTPGKLKVEAYIDMSNQELVDTMMALEPLIQGVRELTKGKLIDRLTM